MDFEWDDAKDQSNRAKHGLSFEEAKSIFADPDVLILHASREEDGEDRLKAIGSIHERLFVVVFTERDQVKRIISARRINRSEERAYGDSKKQA